MLRPRLQRPHQVLALYFRAARGHQAQVAAAARIHHDRRVSGYRRAAIRADGGAVRLSRQPLHRGRPGPDDLHLARRERQISAGFRQGLSKRADHHDDGKLPFHAGDFGGGELADRKKRPPHQKGPAPDEALGREGRLPLCRHAGGRGALDGGRDAAAA